MPVSFATAICHGHLTKGGKKTKPSFGRFWFSQPTFPWGVGFGFRFFPLTSRAEARLQADEAEAQLFRSNEGRPGPKEGTGHARSRSRQAGGNISGGVFFFPGRQELLSFFVFFWGLVGI